MQCVKEKAAVTVRVRYGDGSHNDQEFSNPEVAFRFAYMMQKFSWIAGVEVIEPPCINVLIAGAQS